MTENEAIEIACHHFRFDKENIKEIDGRRTIDLIPDYITEIYVNYYRPWGFFGHWVWRVTFDCPGLLNVGWMVIIDDATGRILRRSPACVKF